MAVISLIAIIDSNRGLGKDNQLLCHLPADLKYFKEITLGKPVIMGRRTYESIGKALPGRLNIVLSKQRSVLADATVVNSLAQALALTTDVQEVMIIGGAALFTAALPLANRIYLTQIHHQFAADVFFPELKLSHWLCSNSCFRAKDEKNEYDLTFNQFERKF